MQATTAPRFPWLILSNPYGSSGSSGGFGSPNPYAASTNPPFGAPPPPKKSNTLLWILGIVGGVAILICACCGIAGYFGLGATGDQLESMLKTQIAGDPVIQEHIGTIQEVEWDIMEGVKVQEEKGIAQPQAFKVKGDKGSGIVYGPQSGTPSPDRILNSPVLKMENGTEYPLANP